MSEAFWAVLPALAALFLAVAISGVALLVTRARLRKQGWLPRHR